ncbi:MAG: flavodoxin family protein [Methanoregulaceae archaeon]|jgi:multimeric flavodoxin WrbA|nr:flavodoxin family protein [Methanoregulaceae archaeon]MDD3091064.1 flavodoxin family protein [Methanoregulaceae archaeon]MDD5049159.1 flavodoxin family protein [Methanoregulaceae archaeon]MDD5684310.1 flavodoxin family protein [Methanoregulaceae archaeon]HOP66176.1 flavodoxin family protein [Methanoregulaceae archaeon]
MDVNVMGISGSPHRHGNTETLLDAFLDGAAEEGAGIEKVILKKLDYSPCRGCNTCHKTGVCIMEDDAPPLFDRILSMDCIAVASPIYSMGITAELKGLIDRAQYLWAKKFVLKTLYFPNEHIQRHKGVFISTAGLSWDNVFDAAFPAITAFFNTIGFEYYDNIIANDMDKYNGIKGHPTALDEARDKGRRVVKEIRSL